VAGGWFNDGTVNREVGAHVFWAPALARRNLRLTPAGIAALVLDDGGGILELDVTAQRLRANLGDAERYVYELLVALAGSAAGTFAYEDNLGFRAAFGQAVCTGGAGDVQGLCFADMRLDFATPEKAAEPAWGALPAPPGTYPGTATLQDYAAGGVPLGTGVGMRIEMARSYPLRELPRARGSRSRGPQSSAVMRFIVSAHLVDRTQNISRALENLERQIGPRAVDLTANGNTYEDVVLESLRPQATDMNHTNFEAEFIQEL
jgi:hypothetical protein